WAVGSSIAVRHTVQHRAAQLVRRARILHRLRGAVAFADEHAGTDVDRRLVADDDAVMALQPRVGTVRPDNGVALEDALAAVVAGDVHALPGALVGARGGQAGKQGETGGSR